MTDQPLTTRQKAILAWIADNQQTSSPTVREIGRAFGIQSPNGVTCHLRALERKGFLRRKPGAVRNLEIVGGPA